MKKVRVLALLLAFAFSSTLFVPAHAWDAKSKKVSASKKKYFISWALVGHINCSGTTLYIWKDFRYPYNNYNAGPIVYVSLTLQPVSHWIAAGGTWNGDNTVTNLTYSDPLAPSACSGYSGPIIP